jgi:hypothetical protein
VSLKNDDPFFIQYFYREKACLTGLGVTMLLMTRLDFYYYLLHLFRFSVNFQIHTIQGMLVHRNELLTTQYQIGLEGDL